MQEGREPIRVLIVDDDEPRRLASEGHLRRSGFEVETATGADALDRAHRRCPAAVLVDLTTAARDDFALCRQLRDDAAFDRTGLVLVGVPAFDSAERIAALGSAVLVTPTPDLAVELAALRATLTIAELCPGQVAHLRSLRRDLGAADARCRALLDHASDAIALVDLDGVVVEANQRWVALAGQPLVGQHIATFAAAGHAEINAAGFQAAVERSGAGAPGPFAIRRSDGTTAMLEFSADMVEHLGRRVVLTVGRDVTAREAAMSALRTSEARYRELLERLPEVVWSRNSLGQLVFVSTNVHRVVGLTVEQAIGDGVWAWFARVHPDDRLRVAAAHRAMMSGATDSFDLEYRFQHADGRWLWLRGRSSARYEIDGVVYCDGLFSDVTDRHLLEDNLRQAQKMEAIGLLAGGIAHDFNNLLAVILADVGALAAALAPDDPRTIEAREIEDAAHRAAALTRQLLVFSRARVVQRENLSVDAVVTDLGRMLRRVIGEDIVLTLTMPREPRARVHIDRSELEQVVLNLAVNARDAMPRGGRLAIAIEEVVLDGTGPVSATGVAASGPFVRLTVSDTGAGMSPEIQARIFEPFFTTKAAGKGTGLGLSTTYAVVSQARGTIAVTSAPDRGSTFVIQLPAIAMTAPTVSRASERPAGGNERVLLVEDDAIVRGAARRILRSSGYDVLEAVDAAEAIQLVADDSTIALVVSDVVMPGASGPELVAALGKMRAGLPWLLISGYTEHGALLDEVIHDPRVFLAKPFCPDDLRRRVRALIDRAPHGGDSRSDR